MSRPWLTIALLGISLAAGAARADDPAQLAQLDQMIAEGRADEAVALAQTMLAAEDTEGRNAWRFRQRLGVALVDSGRPADAVPVLEQALADAPAEPALHLNLARALRAIDHGGRAVAEFGLAVNLAPDRHDWRLEYAEALLTIGIRRDALNQIRRARQLCGDCPEALLGEVNFHLAAGQPAAAAEALRALHAVAPSPATRGLLVRTLWTLGDFVAVAAVLDSVPESELAGEDLTLLLDVDRRLGRTTRSLRWVEDDDGAIERLTLPPQQAWALISEICLAGGEAEAALVAIDRAITVDAAVAVHHHNRAAVLVALGRDDEARQALAEAHRLDPRLGRAP